MRRTNTDTRLCSAVLAWKLGDDKNRPDVQPAGNSDVGASAGPVPIGQVRSMSSKLNFDPES